MMVPKWNPPVWAMRRWVEICLKQYWENPKEGRTICLKPLNLSDGDRALEKVCQYGRHTQRQVQKALETLTSERLRARIDVIMIPVRV